MDQMPVKDTVTRKEGSGGPKKRRTWLVATLITAVVILFFAAVYGLAALLIFNGLKKTGSYLNGAPITISNEVIEARVVTDTEWLRSANYVAFDENLNLTDEELLYRSDIDALQSEGSCVLKRDEIKKGQGGFDGGASINYDGTVECAGQAAYQITAQYHGSALSKKDAADMKRFSLTEMTVKTDREDLVRVYATRSGESITSNVIGADTRDNRQIDSRMYATYDEYLAATKTGELSTCTPDGALSYVISFRWLNQQNPGDLNQYLSAPTFRCK